MSDSHQQIIRAARRLFAERGYHSVSVRDVAAEAGVSAALVMKLVGSKAELFTSSVTFAAEEVDLSHPLPELGRELVRDVLRCRTGPQPLARAVVLALPAPDPDEVRRRFHEAYAVPLAARLGGDERATQVAEMVVAALVGLAVGTRVLRLLPDEAADEEVVATYGAALQTLIDGAGA
ncbi:TetR/AcrR family transcriptional regulator [Arsenicicoccus dermatophilus]|uniref:TetR/AcrR family transcriptional regulator n=1 Tax=Arsenicicoccus dermatophilus TaxID=1076331 RepID=UPI001F4D1068|nr:TetR/AcrR family transcriptional regulator [Arsenicicoccus dermatophilus]MCH8612500.1 TetR family transcriptional regulator [Arsenicicoccus dermatophilus]